MASYRKKSSKKSLTHYLRSQSCNQTQARRTPNDPFVTERIRSSRSPSKRIRTKNTRSLSFQSANRKKAAWADKVARAVKVAGAAVKAHSDYTSEDEQEFIRIECHSTERLKPMGENKSTRLCDFIDIRFSMKSQLKSLLNLNSRIITRITA